jgi:hypothetical protein
MDAAMPPSELCFVGFALRGAADQLARSDDALKQPRLVSGHGCPLSILSSDSANWASFRRKYFKMPCLLIFRKRKFVKFCKQIVT